MALHMSLRPRGERAYASACLGFTCLDSRFTVKYRQEAAERYTMVILAEGVSGGLRRQDKGEVCDGER